MKFIEQSLPGVILIEPDVFEDNRGFFMETYHIAKYGDGGIAHPFVQDNHSRSQKGTLRGLHYQLHHPQAKLVYVVAGEIFDVAADIRRGSPTFGSWTGTILSEKDRRQLFIPSGFAHGFYTLSEEADVLYWVTAVYAPESERGILWNDPDLDIPWPSRQVLLSPRDSRHPLLRDATLFT